MSICLYTDNICAFRLYNVQLCLCNTRPTNLMYYSLPYPQCQCLEGRLALRIRRPLIQLQLHQLSLSIKSQSPLIFILATDFAKIIFNFTTHNAYAICMGERYFETANRSFCVVSASDSNDSFNFRKVMWMKFCRSWKEKLSAICLIFYLRNLYALKKKEEFMHSGFCFIFNNNII